MKQFNFNNMHETLTKEKTDLENQITQAEQIASNTASNLKFLRAKLKLVVQHMESLPKNAMNNVTDEMSQVIKANPKLAENALSKDKPETR